MPDPKFNPGAPGQNPKLSPGLRPPQFGLRTLLFLVTVCGVLLALRQWMWLSPIGIAAIVLLAASVFCHIAGNVIGTRLREIGDQPDLRESGTRRKPKPSEYAPATQLGQRRSLGWVIVIATVAGTFVGGLGGGLWTMISSRGAVGLFSVGVGIVAFATLGGIAAFATVGFIQVMIGALIQAMTPSSAIPKRDCDR